MRTFLFSIGAIALLPTAAIADVETIVVSATRTPQPANLTGTSISVITAQDLTQRQIDITSDALAETPGLDVIRNGGVGQPTSISIRGAETGQTVLLLDGVRLNDPSATDDGAVVGDLLVNNVDRIEILRGPQSTLYGSDAIGGVVNVITRRGGDTPFGLMASAEGGALDTMHFNVASNGSVNDVDYGGGVNYYNTRSVSAADSRNGNPEPDPYQHFDATANLRAHLTDTLSVDLRGYYIDANDSFDDQFASSPPFEVLDSKAYNADVLFVGYAGVNLDLFGGIFHNRLAVMATSSSRQFFNSFYDPGNLNNADYGDTLRLEYQGILDLTRQDEITFGAETQRSAFRSNDYFGGFLFESDTGHARITGYYAQAQHTFFAQLTVTGGVRLDDDSAFGTHTSYKAAAAWNVPGWGTTLRANVGNGFKAPSLFEDFSQYAPPASFGTLSPETATGWEVGADQPFFGDRVRASITYFERHTSNLIDFFSCPTTSTDPRFVAACALRIAQGGFYYNVGRTRASGMEADISAHITDTISLSANYTNQSSTDVASGLPLARRPHNQANGFVTWWPLPDWSVGAGVTFVGARFDDAAATVPLSSVTLFNLYGSWELTDRYELFARIENLMNTHYEPVFGYGAPARAAYAGLRVKI